MSEITVLGKAIRHFRKEKGYSQKDFCIKFKIDQPYFSQIETGKKTPSIHLIQKIADALKITVLELFWHNLSENDIHPDKLGVYKILRPSMDKMLIEIFKIKV